MSISIDLQKSPPVPAGPSAGTALRALRLRSFLSSGCTALLLAAGTYLFPANAMAQMTPGAAPMTPPVTKSAMEMEDYLRLQLPANSPIRHLDTDWGRSRVIQRGSVASAELHLTFHFQNISSQPIHGITLLLRTSGVAPGGRASVTLPGLRVAPGERFPAKVDLRLLQPVSASVRPSFEVRVDGVLFADLSFVGENSLNSHRLLTSLELEIQQDRSHLRQLLRAEGKDALGREMRQVLARQAELPRVDMRWARQGRATALPPSDDVQFAFLSLPNAPLEPLEASARIAGNEALAPQMRVRNRSQREIVYAELGWIIRDLDGREFYAGTVPVSTAKLSITPGSVSSMRQDGVLQFHEQNPTPAGNRDLPIKLGEMVAFVSQVQFADGSIWMPNRYAANAPAEIRRLRVTPEQQRLASVYLRQGVDALVADLSR